MNLYQDFEEILKTIKIQKPLVHNITNYVTANDCANAVLALGGSPIMADDPMEVEEVVSVASALVLNIGTINERRIRSFILAGKKANSLRIPVILDPVGVGATKLRKTTVDTILEEVKISVLRGNMSEIKKIYDIEGRALGIDSTEDIDKAGGEVALELSKRLKSIIVITGSTDMISDGQRVYHIGNGHEILTRITGTGCMTSGLIALCVGASKNHLMGAILGTAIMGIWGVYSL